MHELRERDLGWVAGLLEGEAAFFTRTVRGKFWYPRVSVTMTDRDVLLCLHELTGVGRLTGPIIPQSKDGCKRKPRWNWQVTVADDAVAVMEAVLPFMGERRAQTIAGILARWSAEPPRASHSERAKLMWQARRLSSAS